MGNIKISELPAAGTIDGTEYVEVVQGGVNKKVQISEFPAGTTPTLQEVADTGADTTTPLTYNGVELSTIEIQVTADLTAENDKHYVLVSSAIFTDPTPVTGKGYTILLSNLQTATVGGVAYGGMNGNIVKRYYIAGAWVTRSFYSNEKNVTLYSPIASPTFTGTATTPAIIVSSETASTIASFDASKNIKSLSTGTYPSLTELTYVKGVTSAIQTQLNALNTKLTSPIYAYQNTDSSVTGSTSQTVLANIPIIGGDMGANGALIFDSFVSKIGTAGSVTWEIYFCTVGTNTIGNTGTPTGSTLFASYLNGSANLTGGKFFRKIVNKNSQASQGMYPVAQASITDSAASTTARTSRTFDTSANFWIVVTATLANSGDTARLDNVQIYINK